MVTRKRRFAAVTFHLVSLAAFLDLVSCFTSPQPWRRELYRQGLPTTALSVSVWNQFFAAPTVKKSRSQPSLVLQDFVAVWNQVGQDGTGSSTIQQLLDLFSDDAVWNDYSFSKVCRNKLEIERRFRLQRNAAWPRLTVNDASVVADSKSQKLACLFQYQNKPERGCAILTLNDGFKIQSVDWVMEGTSKGGEASLRTLALASNVIGLTSSSAKQSANQKQPTFNNKKLTPPELYFEAWNRRDMEAAVALFADDVVYDDTAFPEPFTGKERLRNHLLLCAQAFSPTFSFLVDDIAVSDNAKSLAVKWHVENNGETMPFTQGCSLYQLDASNEITSGIDFVEPGPIKMGGVSLLADTIKASVKAEPCRLIPIATWMAYMYIVFLSDGILPGANALALEQRTWEEVLNLSLNFFLVSPLLHLPFSPVIHPMLEGVFNLLLAWAAMFAGFLSDDRRDKPNLFPALPAVAGMQFLTSAFLLPYLALRSTETRTDVSKDELSAVAQATESPILGASMGLVGTGSVAWFFWGRMAEFGPLSERWTTFLDLLSIDRVGSSFIVDLAIFGSFQGWLVEDDIRRRGITDSSALSVVAKYVPFFGLAAYLVLRPPLESRQQSDSF